MVGPVVNVSVIGSETPLGRTVVRRLEDSGARVTARIGDAEAVVRLETDGVVDVERTRAVLRAAGVGGRRVVYTSSAMVYGAWPNNPVPLTEDAPMRPNPGFTYATGKAESERLALEWREANVDARLAVLRPVTVLGGEDDRLARLLRDVLPSGVADPIPPVQYLHGDDLADAVALACTAELDGVFNVAPDGWMSEDEAKALSAGPGRVRLPRIVRPALRPDVPRDVLPYLQHPWVVANDRLRAEGWRPRYSSEEAFVAGAGVPRWQSLSLGRRQAIALGGAAGAVTAATAAAVALFRRRARG
jgi:nucleoside-diphosphate-sugar epimerase